jgi:hypothetical protein
MKKFSSALVFASMIFATGGAFAQDAVGNGMPQPKTKAPTVQECTDRMAAKSDAPKDAAAKKMDKTCARVIAKDAKKKKAAAT